MTKVAFTTFALVGVLLSACSGGGDDEPPTPIAAFDPGVRLAEIVGRETGACWLPGGVSRDGSRVAFVRGSQNSHDDPCEFKAIAVADLASGEVVDIAGVGRRPQWSPDGATILFEGQTPPNARCERSARLLDVETGKTRAFMAPLSSIEGYSPDGKRVLLTTCRDGKLDMQESVVVSASGDVVRWLGGRAIAWTSNGDIVMRDDSSTRFRIVTIDDDATIAAPTPVLILHQGQYPWEIPLEPCDDVIDFDEICY
jgi:hypothetical protein